VLPTWRRRASAHDRSLDSRTLGSLLRPCGARPFRRVSHGKTSSPASEMACTYHDGPNGGERPHHSPATLLAPRACPMYLIASGSQVGPGDRGPDLLPRPSAPLIRDRACPRPAVGRDDAQQRLAQCGACEHRSGADRPAQGAPVCCPDRGGDAGRVMRPSGRPQLRLRGAGRAAGLDFVPRRPHAAPSSANSRARTGKRHYIRTCRAASVLEKTGGAPDGPYRISGLMSVPPPGS
jgi:hypothetical protein